MTNARQAAYGDEHFQKCYECAVLWNCNSCIAFNYSLQGKDTTDATSMTDVTDNTDTAEEGDRFAEQTKAHLRELDELTATYEGWSARMCFLLK